MASNIPILMYHRVDSVATDRNTVLSAEFARQMKFLKTAGYNTIKAENLTQYLSGQTPLPAKPVLLTFDDGYEDNYLNALPLLQEYNFTAIVFPVLKWLGQYGEWKKMSERERLMSWEQLALWRDAGMEIGSHTVNHLDLRQITDECLEFELKESKRLLEDKLNIKVDCLCYPYGALNENVKHHARKAGYKTALAIFEDTTFWGKDDLYALPRVAVSSRTPLSEYKLKVSPAFRIFTGLKILERKAKKIIR
ncbi:MAG: polysaccharide deacetylase family protein [Sporomusaceae bacterium]|nr:polysaccharide deacetylase family protein [Sporomusaceae bacterium]